MSVSDPQPAAPPRDPIQEKRRFRWEVIVALSVLVLLVTIIAVAISSSSGRDQPAAAQAPVSAAAWLQREAPDADLDNPPATQAQPSPAESPPSDPPERSSTTYAPEDNSPGGGVSDEHVASDGQLVKSGTVQSNVPVIKSLTRLGLSMGDAHEIITALEGIYDFRRSRPGHMFEVNLDPDTNKPTYFRYEASMVDVYEVKRKGNRLVGSKKQINTQKKMRRFGGTIASSLYTALVELDAHPTLAGLMVDVLSNQVDFFKEQRPGDTFRVLVEEESLKGTFLRYGPVLALEYNGVKSGKKRFFRFTAGNANPMYYDERKISQPTTEISIPLHYTRISSPFGRRYHPILKRKVRHNGVDFAAPHGTPVWACKAGTVVMAKRAGANGNLVILKHDENLNSYYAHLQRFAAGIKRGVKVHERQAIGYVGSTGRSTGAHLHFGLKKNERFIDPLKYKIRPGRPVPRKFRAKLQAILDERSRILDGIQIRRATAPLEKITDIDHAMLGEEELE